MNTRCIMHGAGALAFVAPGIPILAQANQRPPSQTRPGTRRPAPKNFFNDLRALTDKLSDRYSVKVVTDPAIVVTTMPTRPAEDASLNAALDSLAGQLKRTAWRRVYVKAAQANAVTDPGKLASSVRALELVEHSGLVLENPMTRQATAYVKNYPVSGSFSQELEDQQFSQKAIYVLFSTDPRADASKTMEDRMADLQREQMDLMMQMDPDQLSNAMARGMQMFMNLDPASRAQYMGTMMRAGMQMFQNMPADQRQQLMQDVFQNAGGLFGGAPPPPPGQR